MSYMLNMSDVYSIRNMYVTHLDPLLVGAYNVSPRPTFLLGADAGGMFCS